MLFGRGRSTAKPRESWLPCDPSVRAGALLVVQPFFPVSTVDRAFGLQPYRRGTVCRLIKSKNSAAHLSTKSLTRLPLVGQKTGLALAASGCSARPEKTTAGKCHSYEGRAGWVHGKGPCGNSSRSGSNSPTNFLGRDSHPEGDGIQPHWTFPNLGISRELEEEEFSDLTKLAELRN